MSVLHFNDPYTIVWRMPNFNECLKAAIPGDKWASDPYEYQDPAHGRVVFYFRLIPKDDESDCGLYVCTIAARPEFSLKAKCKMWMEKIDGTSDGGTVDLVLNGTCVNKDAVSFSFKDMNLFRHTPAVFACARLPVKVRKIGTPLPVPTVHRWNLCGFHRRFNASAFHQRWNGSEFTVEGLPGVKCRLSLFPKGHNEDTREFADVFLEVLHLGNRPSIWLQFDLWIERSSTQRMKRNTYNYEYTQPEQWGTVRFVTQEELRGFASGGPIVVCCEVRPLGPPVGFSPVEIHGFSMARSFNKAAFSDLKIRAGARLFPVHRSVLCAQSAAMEAKFSAEANPAGEITIDGYEADVFEHFLRFVYCGEVDNLDAKAARLLPIARAFGLQQLENSCHAALSAIAARPTVECVLPVLEWAFGQAAGEKFRAQLLQFAHNNFADVKQTEAWRSFENTTVLKALLAVSKQPACSKSAGKSSAKSSVKK